MKNFLSSIVLVFILTTNTMAQNPGPNVSWQQCFGTSESDLINSIKSIKSGEKFIATAFFYHKDYFLVNEVDSGFYMLVFDKNFNLIKKLPIPLNATHIIEQPDGQILLAGTTIKFWDKHNVFQNTPDNDPFMGDFAFVQIDSTLSNITWAKAYGSTGQENYMVDVITLQDKSIIFTGTTRGSNVDIPDNSPCFNPFSENAVVFKIDSLGNKQWVKVFGGSGSEIPMGKIIKFHDNLFRIDMSSSSDNCDYTGTTPFSSTGIFKTQIILIDTVGNILKRVIKDDGKDLTWKAGGWRKNGKTYIIGTASAKTALYPTYPSHDKQEFGIGIYNDSLNLIDMKVWGGKDRDILTNYVQKTNNEYYFWGQTASSDGLGDVKNFKGGSADYWLMKTDSNFHVIWSKTVGSAGMDANQYEKFPTDAMLINSSELIIVDRIYPPQVLPNGDVTCGIYSERQPTFQDADAWIVAFDLTTGIDILPIKEDAIFKIYPNPTSNLLIIRNSKPTGKKYKISITDQLGKTVKEIQYEDTKEFSLSIEDIVDGIYFFSVQKNRKQLFVQKILVRK